jgi:hypothetical protein
MLSGAWRRKAYEFCGNCSIFTLNTYEELNHQISSSGLQIFNGSCNDFMQYSTATWAQAGDHPPAKLVEVCSFDSFYILTF